MATLTTFQVTGQQTNSAPVVLGFFAGADGLAAIDLARDHLAQFFEVTWPVMLAEEVAEH